MGSLERKKDEENYFTRDKGQVIMITKERNSKIVKAYAQGYSQHTIAKVLGLSQPAVFWVIKRRNVQVTTTTNYS